MAYTKYSLTPANNTAAPPDGAPEGMLPSAVNDTMRDMMAQIRDAGDGIRNGTYTMTAPVITGGSINSTAIGGSTAAAGAFTTLSASGAFSANGDATLGDASGDALTINSSAVSIPNGLNFDSNTLVIDATNNRVGIGTASPSYALHIAGQSAYLTSGASTALTFIDINSAYGTIRTGIDASGVGYFGSVSNFALALYTNNSERLRIDTSGNVGIGTSSPQAKLQVVNIAKISDSTQGLGLLSLGDGLSTTNNVGVWRGAANSVVTAGNYLNLGGYEGTVFSTGNAALGSQTERMRIDSAGNVLIGRTAVLYAETLSATGYSVFGGTTGTGQVIIGSVSSIGVSGTIDGTAYVLQTNNTERMRIDSSGNVGIGTVSPSSFSSLARNLVVNGSTNAGITVSESTGGGTASLIFAATSSFPNKASITNDFSTNSLQFSLNATERMRIDSSGNVGIGTSSPNASLHLGAQGASVRVGITASDQYGQLSRDIPTGNIILNAAQSGTNLTFQTASTERMRIDSSGNLLVGTTSANGTLTVNGNISPVATPSTKWGIDFAPSTSSGTFVTIANNGTYDLVAGSGVVYIFDNDGNGVASFILYYGVVQIEFQNAPLYSPSINTANRINVYFNGISAYRIQNLTGAARNLFISTIRCRTNA